MLKYRVDKDPYDTEETLFSGKLTRTIEPGFTVLVGCNGSGKSTVLRYIKDTYKRNDDYKVFSWDGLYDKGPTKQRMLDSSNIDLLATLAFASEGEEINTNIGILASKIGTFVRTNGDKNIIILLDGLDSGLSIDNIIDTKEFFKELLIPDVEDAGHECYVIMPANEYELARGERCIDARTGKEVRFDSYEEYRNFVLKSKEHKNKRQES